MQIIDNLSIFQALVFILTNESIIKQQARKIRSRDIHYLSNIILLNGLIHLKLFS